jgi:signal transduction histidine kinase
VSNQTTSLATELRTIPELADLPPEMLEWLAEHMEVREFNAGDLVSAAGAPADRMWVILEGEIQGQRDGAVVFVAGPGRITGMLPYSRLKTFPLSSHAATRARVASLSTSYFPELLQRSPLLGERLVGIMSDRIREMTRADQQREKLMSLGKLSAGLAHELNNPASAARRAAQSLREAVARLRQTNLSLEQQPLSAAQRAELAECEQEHMAPGAAAPVIVDPLERSDREQELGAWLERESVPDAWLLAAGLADSGLDTARVEQLAQEFPRQALGDILWRVHSSILVGRLLDEIESATSRISDMVRAVKEYSYMDQSAVQEIDIHYGIESTLLILKHRLKKGVNVIRDYDRTLPKICARASELNQLWTNLIDNAIDAMHGQGELRIHTAREPEFVLVEIIDNGSGIAPEIRDRIFDPFFTTKEVGEGSGLGLDMVRRIVRGHYGDVRFDSRPGETRFQVRLPLQPPKVNNGGKS